MSYGRNECRIYVGNLPPDIRTKDIQDLFYKFGKVTFVDLKNRRGPPFAFVEFEDPRDAEDAVHARDGYDYDGYRLRVEFPRGGGPGGFRGSNRGGGGGGGDRGGRGRGPPARRSQYRVLVTGLPPSGSWQDLKDHMREAGDVCFADVFKDGTGVVEFLRYEDMKYAVKKLDDSRFRSHEGEVSYIRVKEDYGGGSSGGRGSGGGGRSRSRSYSPRRRGSPTYSPVRRSFSRSRSRSRSRCDVNSQKSHGYTPLHLAAKTGNVHLVRWLLVHGANPYAETKCKKKAVDFAKSYGHREVAELLTVRFETYSKNQRATDPQIKKTRHSFEKRTM